MLGSVTSPAEHHNWLPVAAQCMCTGKLTVSSSRAALWSSVKGMATSPLLSTARESPAMTKPCDCADTKPLEAMYASSATTVYERFPNYKLFPNDR